jgi:molybdopterin-containing oxidoreductase family membrane subunit
MVEFGSLIFGFGLFFTLFLLFCRFMPMIAMFEVKTVLPRKQHAKSEAKLDQGEAA